MDQQKAQQKTPVRMDEWAVVQSPTTGAYGELKAGKVLAGRVFGHPRIQEGAYVFTTPVLRVDLEHDRVETKNTEYILGEASSAYSEWTRKHGLAV